MGDGFASPFFMRSRSFVPYSYPSSIAVFIFDIVSEIAYNTMIDLTMTGFLFRESDRERGI